MGGLGPLGHRGEAADEGLAPRQLEAKPGTYTLAMAVERSASIRVGRLGELALEPGIYLYVGSALGPGGVRARVGRHLRGRKQTHWHLDYVLPVASPIFLLYTYSRRRLEHRWAHGLCRLLRATVPLPGFGASDCSCPAHLVHLPEGTRSSEIQRALARASPQGLLLHQLNLA